MPAKQSQIVSFFQNKKRKTNDSVDKNSSSVDILSNSSNENEAAPESCREISSPQPPKVSTTVSPTSNSLTTVSPISISSTTVSPTSSSLTTVSPLSISSTTVSPTSSSLTTVSPLSLSISSTTVSSPSILSTTVSPTSDSSTIKLKCELDCCISNHQCFPNNQSDLKPSGDKRSCQLGWFQIFKWLSYCKSENKAYCYYCRKAYVYGFHPESNKIGETALTCTGYYDWKNALARFYKHESGRIHADCVYLVNEQQKPTVAARLSLTHQIQQEKRRRMLLIEVECIKYLLRQGLALRGHVEDEGNLIQLLKLRETDVDGLSLWIKGGNYLSHDIINEICQIISLSIVRNLLKEISERQFYSIICDETSDESGTEQLCFTVRSVDSDFIVHEDVLGMYAVTSQSAEHITNIILDILIRCNLDIKYCRGQGYDGAASMAGHISGVSTRITSLCKKAFYIHCNAHSLDLALQDLTRTSSSVSIALNMTKDIVNFMRESPKRLNLLETLSGLDSYTKLKPLCPTRWTVRSSSLNVLLINYPLVKNTLAEINLEGGRVAPKANGLFEQMDKFSSYFGLKTGHLIFSATEEVSCTLQRVENNLQDVLYAVQTLARYLMRIKTNEYFTILYEGIRGEAKLLTSEPSLTRTRKPPSRFIDSLPTSLSHESVYDFYHHEYFEIINNILNSLDSRFKQSIFPLLCKVEKFILSTANGTKNCDSDDTDTINLTDINEFIIDDINVNRLNIELLLLPDYFTNINQEKKLGLKKITKVSTVCELLNAQEIGKTMFYEYCKLIKLYLVVPVTTATAERSFSVLNRMKTYLRCTMTQQRLNHIIIPHIHKDKLDLLDLNSVCSDFISTNENRIIFFGAI